MFTGIIQQSLPIAHVEIRDSSRRLTISHALPDLKHGESIAINGVCLTVAEFDAATARFDVVRETLDKTNLGLLQPGDLVHVERSLRVGDRFDGHFVQGHVDCTAKLMGIHKSGDDVRLRIEMPAAIAKYISPKGSVCVEGVSLTIAAVLPDSFEVALIPTTLAITQLGIRQAGWPFNIECDMIAKTVVRFLEAGQSDLNARR